LGCCSAGGGSGSLRGSGDERLLEDLDVLVDQQARWLAAVACPAGLVQLPKRRPGEESTVAYGGQQREDVLQVLVAGLL
jgi:hypothetical protein